MRDVYKSGKRPKGKEMIITEGKKATEKNLTELNKQNRVFSE